MATAEIALAAEAQRTQVGPYVLERLLGRGGMGQVWLGRHVRTRGVAAVKVLRPDGADQEYLAELFQRERRAVARLAHPHIVRWHELGPNYLATSLVRGHDLSRRIALGGALAPASATHVALQLADALAHAHARGVIHRDVKPSNVLLDAEGNAYLTDFGIALLADEGGGEAPESSGAGTPVYMAPEQRRVDAPVTPAADQYALARTLAAMLLGTPPPAGHGALLAALPPAAPASLRAVIARATAPAPDDRFDSMDALADALRAVESAWFAPSYDPLARPPEPFAWLAAARELERRGPDIQRARFSLRAIEAAGLLAKAACEAFRAATGYDELSFLVYGRSRVLGPLDRPEALARAGQLAVLLHGFMCTGDAWDAIATALCRDRRDLVVLAPDLLGFGATRFREPLAPEHATPRAMLDALAHLGVLLGTDALPTLLAGHSMGATAVLTARDDELPATTWRAALTPVFPAAEPVLRVQLRVVSWLETALSGMPRARAWIADRTIRRSAENAVYTAAERDAMCATFLAASPRSLARVARGFAAARPAPVEQLERATVFVMEGDPVAPEARVLSALDALGFPQERRRRLVSGMHLPQAEHAEHPEWTGRNVSEIVETLGALLAAMRGEPALDEPPARPRADEHAVTEVARPSGPAAEPVSGTRTAT